MKIIKVVQKESRQMKRARVREEIHNQVKQQFSGPRSGLREVAHKIEHQYWEENRLKRLLDELAAQSHPGSSESEG